MSGLSETASLKLQLPETPGVDVKSQVRGKLTFFKRSQRCFLVFVGFWFVMVLISVVFLTRRCSGCGIQQHAGSMSAFLLSQSPFEMA